MVFINLIWNLLQWLVEFEFDAGGYRKPVEGDEVYCITPVLGG